CIGSSAPLPRGGRRSPRVGTRPPRRRSARHSVSGAARRSRGVPNHTFVAEHPPRERFRAQLMRALYGSGRQAEALAAYRDARTYFVEELGIEPNRSLHNLEAAILRQDSTLDRPAEGFP